MLRCLIWAFSGLKREVNFEFSFDLSGKLTINYGFLTGPQIPIHGWGLEQGFWCCLADRLNQRIVKSVVQDTDSPALRILHRILNSILEDFGFRILLESFWILILTRNSTMLLDSYLFSGASCTGCSDLTL